MVYTVAAHHSDFESTYTSTISQSVGKPDRYWISRLRLSHLSGTLEIKTGGRWAAWTVTKKSDCHLRVQARSVTERSEVVTRQCCLDWPGSKRAAQETDADQEQGLTWLDWRSWPRFTKMDLSFASVRFLCAGQSHRNNVRRTAAVLRTLSLWLCPAQQLKQQLRIH